VRVGTSGWYYDHWVGPVYPEGMQPEDMLAEYARSFGTVEINSTFYGLPEAESVAEWYDSTPAGFLFSCKASRYMTHMKKLKDPKEPLDRFFASIAPLKEKLGPILVQLPPRWRANPERLETFLEAAPRDYRYAFEFRDETWFDDAVYDVLRRYGAACCIFDYAGTESPAMITGPTVYVRLHGPAGAYEGSYDDETLATWAERIENWRSDGHDVYCYFDNDQNGYAAANASRLLSMLDQADQ